VLALELERRYPKDRILEMYLNQVYFGQGAYGVEAAARTYFGKPVSDLELGEAALLAGLPRAPSAYFPVDHPAAAKRRRDVVLNRMVERGTPEAGGRESGSPRRTSGCSPPSGAAPAASISSTTCSRRWRRSSAPTWSSRRAPRLHEPQPLDAAHGRAVAPGRAPGGRGALERVRHRSPRGGDPHDRSADGLHQGHGGRLRFLPQRVQPCGGGAAPAGLCVQAVSCMWRRSRRASRRRRSSTDAPVTYPLGRNGKPWKPTTTTGSFAARPRSSRRSRNRSTWSPSSSKSGSASTATIRVARRVGISSPLNADLTLALGTSDLSLLELTSAYSALANQGCGWSRRRSATSPTLRASSSSRACPRARGDGARGCLRDHAHARGRRRARHRPGRETCSAGLSPPRRAPATTTRTRGSSGSRRTS